jgi:hypothetical protein
MEPLVCNVNRVPVKPKAAVNIDSTTVEEVEDLSDNEGVRETKTDKGGMAEEGGADRGTVGILNIP